MSTSIIRHIVAALLDLVDAEMVKTFIDAGLNALEDKIKGTENKIDDAIVLPLIAKLRSIISVPDSTPDA